MTTLKTSEKLDKIIDNARDYFYSKSTGHSMRLETKKMAKFRKQFDTEAEKLGGLSYNFGDCLA